MDSEIYSCFKLLKGYRNYFSVIKKRKAKRQCMVLQFLELVSFEITSFGLIDLWFDHYFSDLIFFMQLYTFIFLNSLSLQ